MIPLKTRRARSFVPGALLALSMLWASSCGGGSPSMPTAAATPLPTPTPTPVPTPTPLSCAMTWTTGRFDPTDYPCTQQGWNNFTIRAYFDLTAPADRDVTIVQVYEEVSFPFNFSPEVVRAGRSERVRLSTPFACHRSGPAGPPVSLSWKPLTLTTSCGATTVTMINRFNLVP